MRTPIFRPEERALFAVSVFALICAGVAVALALSFVNFVLPGSDRTLIDAFINGAFLTGLSFVMSFVMLLMWKLFMPQQIFILKHANKSMN